MCVLWWVVGVIIYLVNFFFIDMGFNKFVVFVGIGIFKCFFSLCCNYSKGFIYC